MSILLIVALVCGAIWLVGTLTGNPINGLVPIALRAGIICFVVWLIWFGAGARWHWRWW